MKKTLVQVKAMRSLTNSIDIKKTLIAVVFLISSQFAKAQCTPLTTALADTIVLKTVGGTSNRSSLGYDEKKKCLYQCKCRKFFISHRSIFTKWWK